MRLLRVTTPEEKSATYSVLYQFWAETDEGWINSRAGKEIEKYEAQSSTNRRIARERTVTTKRRTNR